MLINPVICRVYYVGQKGMRAADFLNLLEAGFSTSQLLLQVSQRLGTN